jgi:hypothetical protein
MDERELIGSFLGEFAVIAQAVSAAERSGYSREESAWVDLWVAGRSSNGTNLTISDRAEWDAVVPQQALLSSRVTGAEFATGREGESSAVPTESPIPSNVDDESLSPMDADVLSDVVPRQHGTIRKLQLAPPTAAVGASASFVTDTGASASQAGADIEVPSMSQPQSFIAAEPNAPSPFPVQPLSGEPIAPAEPIDPVAQEASASEAQQDGAWNSQGNSPQGTARGNERQPGDTESDSASAGGAAESAYGSGAAAVGPNGKRCLEGGPPGHGNAGQSGGSSASSTLNAQPSTPHGPPCTPPGQQNSSVTDPLFVLNHRDGLVMFPGVVEFDTMGESVDLRAQVYGATVQSYSWGLSPRAGCVSGANSYRLQFTWSGYSPVETSEQITITATAIDQTTQQQTLTFKVPAGQTQCSGGGGGGGVSWPAVITPDKPAAAQDQITSDSATRPYAVSLESGALFATHQLPAYGPGVPALGLTYSSVAAERRPILINRYEISPAGPVPNTVSARLQFNGVWGASKYYDTSPSTTKHNPGNALQLSLQSDAGSLATGRYDYTFETTANTGGSGGGTTTNSGTITVINEEASPFGEGWTLDLVDRLHPVTGGVILNQGAGNSLWFASSGPFSFTTPAGDFSTLVKNFDNTYTRTLPDGIKQNFNAAGMQTSIVDRNLNTISFGYTDADTDGAVDELSAITDQNNLVTTLAYPGTCGAGVSTARAT